MKEKLESLRGHLLLDAGGMYGSCFHHTVILMCQHSPGGAFGLVLNQPSDKRIGDVLPIDMPPSVKNRRTRSGGPVDESSVHILHSNAFMFQGNVMNNLSLVQDPGELSDLANSVNPDHKIEVFLGYSGWGAGQLESEQGMARLQSHDGTGLQQPRRGGMARNLARPRLATPPARRRPGRPVVELTRLAWREGAGKLPPRNE